MDWKYNIYQLQRMPKPMFTVEGSSFNLLGVEFEVDLPNLNYNTKP